MAAIDAGQVAWWREPTKDQWYAWWAAWLGWTLDAFDFTVFLLIIKPIADEFGVPTTEVAIVFTLTLWMRLVGAVASGWLADRIGRKTPLMISIFWYSICNFIAGFSPSFMFLLVFRTLLGIGMGAEWPAGAALAMEQWPIRSRGFMSGVLQGSWSIGFLLSSVIYGLFYDQIGWRGMLWIGVLPALSIVWIRYYVKEPPVWVENRRQQRAEKREVRAPLIKIFQRGMLSNTLLACWWMASNFVLYYSIWALFATHLQADLKLTAMGTAVPFMIANILSFLGMSFWGYLADIIGRRWAMIIPAAIGACIGTLSAYLGGWWDEAITRTIDAVMAVPHLLLALILVSTLGKGSLNAAFAISISVVPSMARVTRSVALAVRQQEYVKAAIARGESGSWIVLREMLPNVAAPVIIEATIRVAFAVMLFATLSFLGLGAQPPASEWGLMVSEARRFMHQAPWVIVAPSLAIAATAICFNLLGDGLRDALNPRDER